MIQARMTVGDVIKTSLTLLGAMLGSLKQTSLQRPAKGTVSPHDVCCPEVGHKLGEIDLLVVELEGPRVENLDLGGLDDD